MEVNMQDLARKGAGIRVEELRAERVRILEAFPDLASGGGAKAAVAPVAEAPAPRRRRKMSPAARKAVSERMTRYWAARRKAKGKH